MRKIKYIVIHCSATREDVDVPVETIDAWHKERGFRKIGYHFYIRKDGTIHTGRFLNEVGAHVAGCNINSVGICYEGGLDANGKPKDTRTQAQKDSILECVKKTFKYFNLYQDVSNIKILGHRDFSPDKNNDGIITPDEWIKECPCFDAENEYKDFVL